MNKSSSNTILYLLKSNFVDDEYPSQTFFCPHCLRVEGLMALFPVIRHQVEVNYVDFAKPRGALHTLAGEQSQSCPQ